MLCLKSLSFLQSLPILSLRRRNHHVHDSSSARIVRVDAMENDTQSKFEIDPDEAKQALQKLDQQLNSLSNKQIATPKIKAADVKITRGPAEQEMQEIPGSLLLNTAVVLLIFTIFYNVLFYAVIKPSIDIPDDIPAPPATGPTMRAIESPDAAVMESPPPLLEDYSVQR